MLYVHTVCIAYVYVCMYSMCVCTYVYITFRKTAQGWIFCMGNEGKACGVPRKDPFPVSSS